MKRKPIYRLYPFAAAISMLLSSNSVSAQQNGTWAGGTIANGVGATANFTGVDIAADRSL